MKKYIFMLMVLALVFMLGQPNQALSQASTMDENPIVHGTSRSLEENERLRADEEDWWWVENLGNPYEGCNSNGALILDNVGYPHISFTCGEELRYAYWDGNNWQVQTVDYEATASIFALSISLALDRSEYPHMSFISVSDDPAIDNYSLHYVYLDAGEWSAQTLKSWGAFSPGQTSITLDGGGYPHISYLEVYDYVKDFGNLMYTFKDASGWQFDLVDSGSYSGELKLDKDWNPHILYSTYYPGGYSYAYHNAEGWHIQQLFDVLFLNGWVLDSESFPHFAFTPDGELTYFYLDSAGWHVETLWEAKSWVDLVLDDFGFPHLSYMTVDGMKYTYRDEAGWQYQSVSHEIPIINWRLYLDRNGDPHICFQDSFGIVKYAHNMGEFEPTFFPLVLKW